MDQKNFPDWHRGINLSGFSALYFVFLSRFSCDIGLFWHLFASSFQIKSKGTDLSQGFSADQTLHNDAYLRTEHKTTSASITRR